MIPACLEPLGMDTTRPAAIEPDQVECDPPEDGQILGAMPDADAAFILAKGDAQHPVLGVLDAPVPTDGCRKRGDGAVQTAQVVAHLPAGACRRRPFTEHHPDTAEIRPGVPIRIEIGQQLGIGRRPVVARFQPAVAGILGDEVLVRNPAPSLAPGLGKERLDRVVGGGSVAFEGQHIVRRASADGGRRRGLTVQGFQRHDRAGDIQQRQQGRDGRNLIGMVIDRDLAEDQPGLGRPGADQINGRPLRPMVMRATRDLVIDGDHLTGRSWQDGVDPREETGLEGDWIDPGKDPSEGVMRGDAAWQVQEGSEPVSAGMPILLNINETVGASDDRTHGDRDDVE